MVVMDRFVVTVTVVVISAFASCVVADETPHQGDRLLKVETALEAVLQQNEALLKRVELLERKVEQLEDENKVYRDNAERKKAQTTAENAEEINKDDGQTVHDKTAKISAIKQRSPSPNVQMAKRQPWAKRFLTFQGNTVAFTAIVTPVDLTHLGPSQPIVYDSIITNVGGAYSNNTGIFTAPVNGVYVFNFAMMVMPGENEYLQLVKDNLHVMFNFGHATGASHDVSASRTATLELTQGSEVWVRKTPSTTGTTGNIHGYGFTTFSGWLLAINE